jgi:hypothetical protein
MQYTGNFDISASAKRSNVLVMGMSNEGGSFVAPVGSDLVTVASMLNGYAYWGYHQSPSTSVDVTWLRHMLGQVRAETAVPLAGSSTRDIQLSRTQIWNAGTALHLVPSNQIPGHYFTLENGGGGFLTNAGSCMYVGSTTESDPTTHWVLAEGGEGDYLLVPADQQEGDGAAAAIQDSSGNWVVAVDPVTPDYQQHWNVQLDALGSFQLINRGTGLSLAAGSTASSCATVIKQQGASATEWTIVAH